jgi:biopolymer transport protein ExbB/TolQ
MIHFLFYHTSELFPILACGTFALFIVFERFVALFLVFPLRNERQVFDRIRRYVLEDRLQDALSVVGGFIPKPTAVVVKEGLIRAHQPTEIIEHGLEVKVAESVDRLKARTSFLSMIGNVSTLLGLIGTIMGLIQSFEAVGNANAQERSALLAQGISTAMNHTLWGLTVAVPCMVAYSFLVNRANALRSQTEQAAVKILDIIQQRYVVALDGATQLSAGKKN